MHHVVLFADTGRPGPLLTGAGMGDDFVRGRTFASALPQSAPRPNGVDAETAVHWGESLPDLNGWHSVEVEGETRRAWVAWNPDDPPASKDLVRENFTIGRSVEAADGSTWIIPRLSSLPSYLELTAVGEWAYDVPGYLRPYLETVRKGRDGFEAVAAAEAETMIDATAVYELAEAALRWNYRLPPALVDGLGLLPRDSVGLVAACRIALVASTWDGVGVSPCGFVRPEDAVCDPAVN